MRKREGKGKEGRNERRKECSFSGMVIGNKNVKKKGMEEEGRKKVMQRGLEERQR